MDSTDLVVSIQIRNGLHQPSMSEGNFLHQPSRQSGDGPELSLQHACDGARLRPFPGHGCPRVQGVSCTLQKGVQWYAGSKEPCRVLPWDCLPETKPDVSGRMRMLGFGWFAFDWACFFKDASAWHRAFGESKVPRSIPSSLLV